MTMTMTDIGRRASLAGYTPVPNPAALAMIHPNGLAVIVSIGRMRDGRDWVHMSVSRKNRSPSWDDLIFARDTVLGRDTKAIQVFPPASEHVNIHPHCHHLWHCITEDPLPDFRTESGLL